MWIKATCNLAFQMPTRTPLVLMLRPRSGAQQWIARESYTLTPYVPVVEYTDIYGNLCQRLVAPYGAFSIHTSADVKTTDVMATEPGAYFIEIQNLPESVLAYLLPSRYCESARFGDLARSSQRVWNRGMIRWHASTAGFGIPSEWVPDICRRSP